MHDIIERDALPLDEVDLGATEKSLQVYSRGADDIGSQAILFDTGTLFISDTFKGSTRAAHILSKVRSEHQDINLKIVPAAVLLDYQRSKNSKSKNGINVQDDKEVLREIGELCRTAAARKASDIHMFPEDGRQQVRMKVNGDLIPAEGYSFSFADQMMQAVHVACDAATREASYLVGRYQHGRLLPEAIGGMDGYEAIRCQWNPETKGRDLFMRLQIPLSTYGSLKGLRYKDRQLKMLMRALGTGKGGVLLAAPTNAGKTTTMGMMCKTKLSGRLMNGISIEDPAEYILPMRQFSINAGDDEDEIRKMTSKAFKAINRSDPDAVMVGEIRGGEFGEVVVKIAASHFLIGSFHADSSMEAFPQLARLGIDPGDVYDSKIFRYLLVQRLLQQLCTKCSTPISAKDIENNYNYQRIASFNVDLTAARKRGHGCSECNHTGVTGMFPIIEIIKTDRTYMDAVKSHDVDYANKLLKDREIPSMADEALSVIASGNADPENVMSALGDFESTDVRFGVLDG